MHYIWAHLLKLYWDCGPVALSVVMSVILVRALNAGPCNSHWISSPNFLPVKTMVWGRGAEQTTRVMFDMSIDSSGRCMSLKTGRVSQTGSFWHSLRELWTTVWVTARSCDHWQGPALPECPHCFMLHPKLCPFYLVSYDTCCEIALRSSSTANIFNPFSRESCNQKLGDNH